MRTIGEHARRRQQAAYATMGARTGPLDRIAKPLPYRASPRAPLLAREPVRPFQRYPLNRKGTGR